MSDTKGNPPKPAAPSVAPVNGEKEKDTLLRKLKGVKDQSFLEARSLRRALRAFGHNGGLRALDGAK